MFKEEIIIDNLIFNDLGGAFPRQIEVYSLKGDYLAYIRYRYGCLTVSTKPLGYEICCYYPKPTNCWNGDFTSDIQAMQYFKRIAKKINKYYYLIEHPKRRYKKKNNFVDSVFSEIIARNIFESIIEGEPNGEKINIKRPQKFTARRIGTLNGGKNEKDNNIS